MIISGDYKTGFEKYNDDEFESRLSLSRDLDDIADGSHYKNIIIELWRRWQKALEDKHDADLLKEAAISAKVYSAEVRIKSCVPFQKCPICAGTGKLTLSHSNATSHQCDVCNGSKIIPMHVEE
jgi:hypothetical protein